MTVYDVGRTKMGNTTLTTISVWPVGIISVNLEKRTVQASWNGNPARTYSEGKWSKWRAEKPVLVRSALGRYRLATPEEKRAMKAAASA